MSQNTHIDANNQRESKKTNVAQGCLDMLTKRALMILVILVAGGIFFSLARAAVYKIRPYERGLHLRGGKFIDIDQPGWHIQIPFVDTVIPVIVIERSGTIDSLAAMTADDVTMDVSLLYTYKVIDPVRYQLEVLDPEAIVAGFVKGTLRDVVNTRHRRCLQMSSSNPFRLSGLVAILGGVLLPTSWLLRFVLGVSRPYTGTVEFIAAIRKNLYTDIGLSRIGGLCAC